MMKKTSMLICAILVTGTLAAQQSEKMTAPLEQRVQSLEETVAKQKKLKISGYLQAQYQWGEEKASLKVGSSNTKTDESFSRLGIRRGRIKFTYEEGIASGVFQLDITEKGVGFKDAYLNIKDPWVGSMALRAGIFDRPFGYEISYSSSRRESPERSTVFQTLFPDERDLGGMLVLQAPGNSPWNILKLQAGFFAGNGIQKEVDNKRDFIGQLILSESIGKSISFGAGASYYNGRVYQGNSEVYTMAGNGFVLNDNTDNIGKFAKREYIGFDARIAVKSLLGSTELRGEYLFGQQPGTASGTKSPNSSSLPSLEDATSTYIRDFNGGYVMLVQKLGKTPLSVVGKYDWYDPNTDVSEDEIGHKGTNKADLAQNTVGAGALWDINSSLRLQVYYEFNQNEKTTGIGGYNENIKNDLFTLRLQYKF